MHVPGILLIDDSSVVEERLLRELGLPRDWVVRDAEGGAIQPGDYGLVLLNAELQRNFAICRRLKKSRDTSTIPLAFFTLSTEKERLKALAEHRSLPTHADYYLFPPLDSEKLRALIERHVGPIPETPVADGLEAVLLAAEAAGAMDAHDAQQPSGSTETTPPPAPEEREEIPVLELEEEVFVPENTAEHDRPPDIESEILSPPEPPFGSEPEPQGRGPAAPASQDSEPLSDVENYIKRMQQDFAGLQQQLLGQRAARDRDLEEKLAHAEAQVARVAGERDQAHRRIRSLEEEISLARAAVDEAALKLQEAEGRVNRAELDATLDELSRVRSGMHDQELLFGRLEDSYRNELESRDKTIQKLLEGRERIQAHDAVWARLAPILETLSDAAVTLQPPLQELRALPPLELPSVDLPSGESSVDPFDLSSNQRD